MAEKASQKSHLRVITITQTEKGNQNFMDKQKYLNFT